MNISAENHSASFAFDVSESGESPTLCYAFAGEPPKWYPNISIDIAHLDRDLVVLSTTTMSPWRFGAWSPRASAVIEAEAGAFRRWGLERGMQLEIRE